ncbi:MAG: helix-turn-helix domain-containing protein [Anaerolineae bacterium]
MQTDLTFSAWLKRKRREQGLTQETLAGLSGCSTTYLRKIEAGQRQPTRQVVDALLDALQVPQAARPTYVALAFAKRGEAKPKPIADLPTPLTSFIGREHELASVQGLLERKTARLITLTGTAGVGKTRVALQVAANMLGQFEDGVYFVDLAPISAPDLVVPTIARALDVRDVGARPILDVLKEALRNKQMLLVLDNFEQVLAAAPLVSELLVAAPRVKVLATSRVVLRMRGEHEFPVQPLPVPNPEHMPSLSAIAEYAAIALFVERAVGVQPNFAVTDENALAIARICSRLDGLPLAIELAAARIKVFPPDDLLQRLDSRLKTLTGGARDLPARQQTLRDAIAWSYDLLGKSEKMLFRRLGVFVGGFTFDAAAEVCDRDGDLGIDVVDGIGLLLDKSLLSQQRSAAGEPRFGMLETIREYALEQLVESGEIDSIPRAHARHFLMLAETAEPELAGPQQKEWLDRLAADHDNIRAAHGWMLARGEIDWGLRFVRALWRFWYFRSHFREGHRWTEDTLARAETGVHTATYARALDAAARFADSQGDADNAAAYSEKSSQIFLELGDQRSAAYARYFLGLVVGENGDPPRAYALHQANLALFQSLGDERGESGSEVGLGMVAAALGDYSTARVHLERSAMLRRKLGDKSFLCYALGWLALVNVRLGDLGAARAALAEAVAVRRELADEGGLAAACEGLAAIAAAEGRPGTAARLFGTAETVREKVGVRLPPSEMAEYLHHVAIARTQMAEDEFAAAWAEGRAMSLEDALALALSP